MATENRNFPEISLIGFGVYKSTNMSSPPDLSSIFEGRFPRKRRSCSHDCHVIQNPIGNVNTQGLPDIQNLGDSIGNAKNQVLADEPSGDPIEIVNTQGLPVIQNLGDSIENVNTQGLPDIQNLSDSIGNAKDQVLTDEPLVESILVYNTQGLPVIRKKLGDSIWYVNAQGLPDLQNLGDSIGNAKNQPLADEPSGDPIRIVNTQGLPDESLCPSKAQTHLGDMKTHLERFPVSRSVEAI